MGSGSQGALGRCPTLRWIRLHVERLPLGPLHPGACGKVWTHRSVDEWMGMGWCRASLLHHSIPLPSSLCPSGVDGLMLALWGALWALSNPSHLVSRWGICFSYFLGPISQILSSPISYPTCFPSLNKSTVVMETTYYQHLCCFVDPSGKQN